MPIVEINTSKDINFYSKWYSPNTKWPLPKNKIVKLSNFYSFDLKKMQEQVNEIKTKYGFEPFPIKKNSTKKRRTYKGIGLTSRPEANNPLYDALHLYGKDGELDITDTFKKYNSEIKETTALYEKQFSEPTEINKGYLAEVLSKFKSLKTKTRLLDLCPKGVITPHVDFPYYEQIRVLAVLETNNNAFWEVEGQKFQVPADGNFYWFDKGRYHAVWNDGNTDRIVLSVNLSLYQTRDGKEINNDINIDDFLISTNL